MTFSRREILKHLAALGATVGAGGAQAKSDGNLFDVPEPVRVEDPRNQPPDGRTAVEDMYRAEFAETFGDDGEHGFAYHCVNCQGNCAWQV